MIREYVWANRFDVRQNERVFNFALRGRYAAGSGLPGECDDQEAGLSAAA